MTTVPNSPIAFAIAFILSNFTAVTFVLALLLASIIRRGPAANRYLAWLCLLPIGIGTLWGAFYHLAFPGFAAHFIGWADSPFQFEVGMADLAIGVAGCIAFRASYGFQAATVIVTSIAFLGDALGHIRQMHLANNHAPGNAGSVFYFDILIPLTALAFLLAAKRQPSATTTQP
ncbi:MAG: DUF6790 family protein [Candidatus Acidiferrum sp.]